MAEAIRMTVVFVLSNYSLVFLVIGLVVALVVRLPKPVRARAVIDGLLGWYVFFAVGINNIYNFFMHVFFARTAAHYIGWQTSPFQFEVGVASLGFGVVGLIGAFRSFDLRLAAVTGAGIFMLGAAVGHIRQMITAQNFAPGNAGIVFYTDIAIPLIGFLLLWLGAPTKPMPGAGD